MIPTAVRVAAIVVSLSDIFHAFVVHAKEALLVSRSWLFSSKLIVLKMSSPTSISCTIIPLIITIVTAILLSYLSVVVEVLL